MSKPDNIPPFLQLDDWDALVLSACCARTQAFPYTLRERARVRFHHLHKSVTSGQLEHYSLLGAAYVGVAPLPVNYGRWIIKAQQLNKQSFNPPEYLKDAALRENSAAREYGMSRGELKRLLEHLDSWTIKFAGLASYEALFNCEDAILNDSSPYAPDDRDVYARGPLYLWDLAKVVKEERPDDLVFGTYRDWIAFLRRENNRVIGHAILPGACRFGNFLTNPYVDLIQMCRENGMAGSIPIMEVPTEVNEALQDLAARCFPGLPFAVSDQPKLWGNRVYRPDPPNTFTPGAAGGA